MFKCKKLYIYLIFAFVIQSQHEIHLLLFHLQNKDQLYSHQLQMYESCFEVSYTQMDCKILVAIHILFSVDKSIRQNEYQVQTKSKQNVFT